MLESALPLPAEGSCRLPRQLLLGPELAPAQGGKAAVVSHWRHWPVRPGSMDMVILPLAEQHRPHLPALIQEASLALGPDAWLLVVAQAGMVDRWSRLGAALAERRGLVLREAAWGDARKFSLLPARWSRYWSVQWQNLLPGTAQWTVQLWQKETFCLIPPERKASRGAATAWSGSWAPQSRAGTSHIKNPVKDCA